jgi:lysophospholipase L1-like esterase
VEAGRRHFIVHHAGVTTAGRRGREVVLAVLASVLAVPGAGPAAAAEPDPVRIMLVGDSVTQGSAGDWTWRYRLWEHLQSPSGPPVDLVGGRTDLYDNVADVHGSQAYADPSFDQDHEARWGMLLSQADTPIDQLVEEHAADVVVSMLGTNDLLVYQPTPATMRQHVDSFVAAARSANPGLTVVLCEITQTWFEGAPAYNQVLAEAAADLDEPGSRVLLADTDAGFTTDDTWDGSHPTAGGEAEIAAAVADALAGVGIGTAPVRPLPEVAPVPWTPPVAQASGTTLGAHVEWTPAPGATRHDVWLRDVTAGTGWERIGEDVEGHSFDVAGLPAWHEVQLSVRPWKGTSEAGQHGWTAAQTVEVQGDRLDAPAGPTVTTDPLGRVVVGWEPVAHADSYVVEWRPVGSSTWTAMAPTSGLSATLGDLDSRRTYAVRVRGGTATGLVGDHSGEQTVRAPARTDDPAEVMLLGDSLTIGSTGDWTWRYRLWRHLAATAPGRVDLVGSRDDLFDRATSTYGHQAYVDPRFDRDHQARWGENAAFLAPLGPLVDAHDVDVLVEMLGTADLAYLLHTPTRVAADLRDLVGEARAANPEVDVVLGEVPAPWRADVVELNAMLHALASELDTPTSRVVVAETADGASRLEHTYDDSHLNARGEVLVAAAVADALARLDLGRDAARPLPSVPIGPRTPVALRGRVTNGKVKLRWSASTGADGYRVMVRQPARSSRWRTLDHTARLRMTVRGLRDGRRYQFLVLPAKGRAVAGTDVRSNRVSLRV